MAIELGLNAFQVIQNELISREGSRSTIGLGARLAIIEERIKNNEACARNGQIWRLNHAVHPISVITPEAKIRLEKQREKLLNRKGADTTKDDKDPTMLSRHEEIWAVHEHFPKTILDFKQLQFRPGRIRSLIEWYEVRIYRPDMRPLALDHANNCRDIKANIELCLEELAIGFGLNWFRMGGLSIPAMPHNGLLPHANHPTSAGTSSPNSSVHFHPPNQQPPPH